jgi:hypothetical protein
LGAVVPRILAAREVRASALDKPEAVGLSGDGLRDQPWRISDALQHVDAMTLPLIARCYNDAVCFRGWEQYMKRNRGWTAERCATQSAENLKTRAAELREMAEIVFSARYPEVETFLAAAVRLAEGTPAVWEERKKGGPRMAHVSLQALQEVLSLTLAARRSVIGQWIGPSEWNVSHIDKALQAIRFIAWDLFTSAYPPLKTFRCRWLDWTQKEAW